jgi:predicted dienelactone hydrolase
VKLSRIAVTGLISGLVALATLAPAQAAGFQHVVVPGPDGKTLETGIWYPSAVPVSPQPLELFTQMVAPNGAIAGDALPLVVITSDARLSYWGHYDTALALADAGFVVAAVAHAGDDWRDQASALHIMDQPREIAAAVDYLLAVWPDRAHVDPKRIGIFGFAGGGFAALVAAGGEPDLPLIGPHCTEHSNEPLCAFIASDVTEPRAAPVVAFRRFQDTRIRAAVIAAPSLGFTFTEGGLKGLDMPVQLWRAGDDAIAPSPFYAEPVLDALPQTPDYTVVPNAGHYDFIAPCSALFAAAAPALCTSEPVFDRSAFHTRFNAAVVAFFEKTLAAK